MTLRKVSVLRLTIPAMGIRNDSKSGLDNCSFEFASQQKQAFNSSGSREQQLFLHKLLNQ
jgi:hypothetical protein